MTIPDVALQLTAIALLLRPMGPWFVRPGLLGLAALVVLAPSWRRSPAVWGSIAALVGVRIASDWPLADNHIYLLGYWTLAIALALLDAQPDRSLERSSRWLIGLAFAFAVLWKGVLAPDFVDGRFFRVTLLTDPRFEDAARLIGGLSRDEIDSNREALAALPEGAVLQDPPAVRETTRLRWLAATATWGMLALEACVAIVMLMPARPAVAVASHLLLLGFCALTYAFAPVAGFGWLLLAMGAAQTSSDQRRLQTAYVALFLVVLFYSEIPWAGLLTR